MNLFIYLFIYLFICHDYSHDVRRCSFPFHLGEIDGILNLGYLFGLLGIQIRGDLPTDKSTFREAAKTFVILLRLIQHTKPDTSINAYIPVGVGI